MGRRFKVINDSFQCEYCGHEVPPHQHGSCRNHCTNCLSSKHVDQMPGDRMNTCKGRLAPVHIQMKGPETTLHFRCDSCGFEGKNKSAPDDSLERMLEILRGDGSL